MSTDADEDLFGFLYTIAAGVRLLQSRTGISGAELAGAGAAVPSDEQLLFESFPDLSLVGEVIDRIHETLSATEARVLQLGQELTEGNPSVEATRATHDAVRGLLDLLAAVRTNVDELRSFDHREAPLRDFLASQRRALTRVRKSIDTMNGPALRDEANRQVTLQRLRSGLPNTTS